MIHLYSCGVITPDAVISDVHAFFALAVGGRDRAVDIDACLEAEIVGLLLPNFYPGVVEDVLAEVDWIGTETAAIIACGRGIGNALGAEGVEKGGVVAAQLDV